MDIVVWLRSLGLGKYEAAFRENEIDETVLPSLTHENLKELGVTALGHRLKLLDAIAALRGDASGKAPSVDAATTSSAPSAPSRRPCRASAAHGDVLRPSRFDGIVDAARPGRPETDVSHGSTRREAIVEATVRRARPVILTALAAILAMIPLSRSPFWAPMAITIMGGLFVATFLTAVVPAQPLCTVAS